MLDINTPRGREAAKLQREAIEVLEKSTGAMFLMTADDDSADIDAISFGKERIIQSVMEIKSRNMTMSQLKGTFKDEWLITFTKILSGAQIAASMRVPFIGALYLVPDKMVLTIRITDKDGVTCVPFRVNRTESQKTTNGGRIVRANAFIDMAGAKIFALT